VLDQAANSLPLLSTEELAALAREQGVIVPGGADLPGQNDLTDEQAQETGRVDNRAGVSDRRRDFILNGRTELPSQNDLTDEQTQETATTGGDSGGQDGAGISERRRDFIINNNVEFSGPTQSEIEKQIDKSVQQLKRDIRKELPRGVGP
jgi:LPS O-antigen subunit length determinant protein (WzzB/FepE family)